MQNLEDQEEAPPLLITGLILATWVQTIFAWRPLVSIIGESNSGKSVLFETLGGSEHQLGIFGKLARLSSKSSEAGVRQEISNSAVIVLCDEFEKSRERDKILEILRSSSRGSYQLKGTANQKGTKYRLRHITWVAAIESGLKRAPDINRFIMFELLKAKPGQHGKLRPPSGEVLHRLGQKLLAIAVSRAIEAKQMAIDLKDTPIEDAEARAIESYAVPAAMLATAKRANLEGAQNLLKLLMRLTIEEKELSSDQEDLIDAIMGAEIYISAQEGIRTVSQILERTIETTDTEGGCTALERVGIRRIRSKAILEGEIKVFMVPKLVVSNLLVKTPWEGQRIDQILRRIDVVQHEQHKIAGRRYWGISITLEAASLLIKKPAESR